MRLFYIYIFFTLNITLSFSQSFKYRNYKFEWPEQPAPIKLDSTFRNSDAVILAEKCIYNQGGNKVPEYTFVNFAANYYFFDKSVQGTNPVIKRYRRIKFLNRKGIEKHNRIVIPESFDPSFDSYNVRPQWQDSILRPLGEFECVRYFAARIIKPDGKIIKANVSEKTIEYIFNSPTSSRKHYCWIFEIKDLEVGDEVELDYSYEGIYNFGASNRIFFNADIPIQELDFTFRYPDNKYLIMNYHNGLKPTDSVMATISSPHFTEYYFNLKNIPGGINEPGSRPYKQLPHFTFYNHKWDYGIPDPKTDFIKKPLPYPWTYVMLPLVGYKMEDLSLRLSRIDNTTIVLNEYTEKLRQKADDTSAAYVISELHRDLSVNFNFFEDYGYYLGEHNDLEHLGKYIENKVLRQMSRFRIYTEVMMRMNQPYYLSILSDKRISEIDINNYEQFICTRLSIAVPYKDYILHYYPKSYRFGYETNELPFYYEGINTILTPQNEKAEKKFELVPRVEFKFIKTPSTDSNNNIRNIAGKINVSLDSIKASVQAKIRLSGQFSTMIRGYYLYGSVDTTINTSYYNGIDLSADKSKSTITKIISLEKKYPFESSFSQEFTINNHLEKTGNNEFRLSLSKLFNNITLSGVEGDNRQLDYYPDFQSHDIHRYLIHFDHPVEIVNISDYKININNLFADYDINISQPSESDILLESSYKIKTDRVPAADVKDVEFVFNSINTLNSSVMVNHKAN